MEIIRNSVAWFHSGSAHQKGYLVERNRTVAGSTQEFYFCRIYHILCLKLTLICRPSPKVWSSPDLMVRYLFHILKGDGAVAKCLSVLSF